MQIQRDLGREAHLWYTITSADFVAHAKPRLQVTLDMLRAGVNKQPFLADYRPVPYWGGVMEDLLANFDHALSILKAGNFEPMQRWASRVSDVPRGFRESNLGWLSQQEEDRFMKLLNDVYSVCSRFLSGVAMSESYSSEGYKEGTNAVIKIADSVPEDVKKKIEEVKEGLKAGSFDPFKGPIVDTEGKERLPKDQLPDQAWKDQVDFYVKGVEGKVPTGK